MAEQSKRTGVLGVPWHALDGALWLATSAGFLWLMASALPRQPAFALFMSVLGVTIFVLALLRAEWALMLMIAVIPGITTITVTVFNRWQPGAQTGVFGPAAYVPVMAFVLGVWARAWIYREDTAPSRLRAWLLAFLALSVLSALVTCWRYADFWPLYNRPYLEQTVNVEGLLAGEAMRRVVWTLVNYLSGPLLFLAVCHVAAQARRRAGTAWNGHVWLLRRVLVPLWIGSAAPFLVGRYQTFDVWFGANRVYVWPWMKRINATFFDPNALGAYVTLIAPWLVALACLAGARCRRALVCSVAGVGGGLLMLPWLHRGMSAFVPPHSTTAYVVLLGAWLGAGSAMWFAHRAWILALPVGLACGLAVRMSAVLAGHAGSRTAVLGLMLSGVSAGILLSLQAVLTVRQFVAPRVLRLMVGGVCLLYLAGALWLFYNGAPRLRTWLQRQPVTKNLPLVKRFNQLPLGSFKRLYRQIVIDRGPHALLALAMLRDAPLTGTGLGSFLTELPNWKKRERLVIYVPDTACNYYLQIAAEQGALALVVMLAVFAQWWRHWWLLWQRRPARCYWLWIGAGMISMLAVFIFGMHTLAAEIQALFWLYMAQGCVVADHAPPPPAPSRYRPVLWGLIVLIIVLQSAAQLSLPAQRAAFGWQKREGFYPPETWQPSGLTIRHTHQHAEELLTCHGLALVQPFACLHPDISHRPVAVSFALGASATNLLIADHAWRHLTLHVPFEVVGQALPYRIHVDRTWTGRDARLNDDTRPIGVTLQDHRWLDSVGMYAPESWQADNSPMAGREYRWSSAQAQMLVSAPLPFLLIPVLAAHPDITSLPVTVSWHINGLLVSNITYATPGWRDELLLVPELPAPRAPALLSLAVSRPWSPADYGQDDSRILGIALGTPLAVSDTGLYHVESWNNQFDFKWAGRSACWAQRADSNGLIRVQVLITHPDVATQPVRFTLQGASPAVFSVSSAAWHTFTVTGAPLRVHALRGTVDRTWRPREHGMNDDRELGFAVRF